MLHPSSAASSSVSGSAEILRIYLPAAVSSPADDAMPSLPGDGRELLRHGREVVVRVDSRVTAARLIRAVLRKLDVAEEDVDRSRLSLWLVRCSDEEQSFEFQVHDSESIADVVEFLRRSGRTEDFAFVLKMDYYSLEQNGIGRNSLSSELVAFAKSWRMMASLEFLKGTLSGFLEEWEFEFGCWRLKWSLIIGENLFIYSSQYSKTPLYCIPLEEAVVSSAREGYENMEPYQVILPSRSFTAKCDGFLFKLTTEISRHIFKAPTLEIANCWIDILSRKSRAQNENTLFESIDNALQTSELQRYSVKSSDDDIKWADVDSSKLDAIVSLPFISEHEIFLNFSLGAYFAGSGLFNSRGSHSI